jgi:hypothetical protein
MFQHKIFMTCGLMLFFLASGFAQSQPSHTPTDTEKARLEQEKKAMTVLDELLAEAQSLRLPENRAYVQVTAADLLWEKDEPRARSLFQEATSTLAQIMNSIESDDPNFYGRVQAPNQLRQQMIQIVARRDAQLALNLLRTTRPPKHYEEELQSFDAEEMQLAGVIAQNDPKRALQIAEENLQKGVTSDVLQTIHQLQSKDPEAATQLTGKVVQKLKQDEFLKDYSSMSTAASLLSLMQNDTQQNNEKKRPLLSEQDKKAVIELLTTTALKTNLKGQQRDVSQHAMNTLQQLLPLVEKYVPTQVQALRRQTTPAAQANDPYREAYQEFNQLQQKGTLEQMLDFAKNAAPELRNQFYLQAAWKAVNQGNSDRARDIINTHLPAHQRRNMLENLDTTQMHNLANEGKLDEARRILSRIPSNERRAGFLLQMIDIVGTKADEKTKLQILEEARSLLGQRADNHAEFNAQINLIGRFVLYDPKRSFEMYDPLVTQLNSLIAAAETLDSIEQRYAFSNGEMRLQLNGGGIVSSLLQQLSETLSQSAAVDFDRARSIADRFDRSELRLLARLNMVRKILSEPGTDGSARRVSRLSAVPRR